jgi:hypothetical protein
MKAIEIVKCVLVNAKHTVTSIEWTKGSGNLIYNMNKM